MATTFINFTLPEFVFLWEDDNINEDINSVHN